jgi:hypothetical protein
VTPLVFALLAATAAPSGVPAFEVSGSVAAAGEDTLDVRVDLANRGGDSGAVAVVGELAGHYDEATVPAIGAGETGAAHLRFPREVPRPGVYPVVLRLDYAPRVAPAGRAAPASLRAFLLLSLGAPAAAAPAVRVSAPDVLLADRVLLPVALQSADGAAHRVRLRVLGPRGLNPERARDEVDVPAAGRVIVEVPLLRGSVPRGSRQWVLLVAETLDGEVARTSTATTTVEVEADPAWLPGLRVPLVLAGALLLVTAGVIEWLHLRRVRAAPAEPSSS